MKAQHLGKLLDGAGNIVAELLGPPNDRLEGNGLSQGVYMLSEVLIRGWKPEKRGGLFGGEFGYGVDYENETFLLHPDYMDAECSCGFDQEYGAAKLEGHDLTCFQTVVSARLDRLHGIRESTKLEVFWDLEKRLAARMAKDYGLPGDHRWQCTCGSKTIRDAWLATHHHSERCALTLPNFWHKPSDFRLKWYKYIGREMEPNRELSGEEWSAMWKECFLSIPSEIRESAQEQSNHEHLPEVVEEETKVHNFIAQAFRDISDSEKPCWYCSKDATNGTRKYPLGGTYNGFGPAGTVVLTLRSFDSACSNCKLQTSPLQERILIARQERGNRYMFRTPPTIGEKIP